MSTRNMKKVFGVDDAVTNPVSNSEDDEPIPIVTSKPRRNNYELLQDSTDPEEKVDDVTAENAKGSGSSNSEDEAQQRAKTKKKKKKRKKNRNGKKMEDEDGADFELNKSDHKTIKTLDDDNYEGQKVETEEQPSTSSNCFKSDGKTKEDGEMKPGPDIEGLKYEDIFPLVMKHMSPEAELKRMYGAQALKSERTGRVFHKHKLVAPKIGWPPTAQSGLLMKRFDWNLNDDCVHFKFEHSEYYKDAQRRFLQAVRTNTPENIQGILRSHPYHVSSQIQMAEWAKDAEDMKMTTELIELSVYCMEKALHIRFDLTNPNHRIDYKYQENREFFLVLFKHMYYCGTRGCYRTALELSKRLFCFDPLNDPLAVILLIDYYALKSGEHEWLLLLYDSFEPTRNLSQLPNFAYSVALAKYFVSLKSGGDEDKTAADDAIQSAITMFPFLFVDMVMKCTGQFRFNNHNFFRNFPSASYPPSLKLLVQLYMENVNSLWKDRDILAWLNRNGQVVIEKVDQGIVPVTEIEEKRRMRYGRPPFNILRHAYLIGSKEVSIPYPPEVLRQPILNYDPLPPINSIDLYPSHSPLSGIPHYTPFGEEARRIRELMVRGPQPNPEVPADDPAAPIRLDMIPSLDNMLSSVLRRLLPTILVGVQNNGEPEEDDGSDDD